MQTENIINFIVNWLKEYATKAKMEGFIIGISGGIDSAVTSVLCAKTGLPTLCVEMPIYQDMKQVSRGQHHIQTLQKQYANVSSICIELTSVFDSFKRQVPVIENKHLVHLSLANTRARLRMTTLYYFAGMHRYLVVGTGNKVEDFGVGFYTKYGDGGVDLSPIADLLKSEVYSLGKVMKIADSILTAAPTDGLYGDDRTDEEQLGASYKELEWAMQFLQTKKSLSTCSEREKKVLKIYKKLNSSNQHKMKPIPICKIPPNMK
ncbi:MAG: NAD(+) synthase [Flavobacteriaceae bacterium CG_4_8_14_3_um_filter_34_10]|nr:MAG: NAD(+) synthase [Flavobacteriaceae bacterium CG18_big_fil_WC_8_21_14_2_50_34_36]PIV51555.1 MAG: NAD(+) synthase [Flavobacteriaceae bacterium CG02_land_8_20_14_3_00_34_13]PIX08138.1 MAG: NAD(+) synthase [Flavobacteriaceae bacterium CG_4_8_14_3_um_filter_34_10]PIZ07414.1 MAG: NAD(+) synthase [Flavobacteriaceae bacterium CG_4_10_14_0_8_um_filter_34_31]PJC08436.1 MAG: NAD(+) synthase [Flavobacteriaceae bacterium CG_4_9_14_0_8_um_filter_34_30]